MAGGHGRGSEAVLSVARGQGGWREDSGGQHPMTGVLQAAPRHSLSSVAAIGPAASDTVQTVQAGAGEVGGGKGGWGDGGGEEGEAGKPDHWTTVMGMGRAWVSVAQNKSEGQEEGHCRRDSAVH